MLYEFKQGHNTAEAMKNICCAKGKGAINHSTVTRWFKKFCSNYKSFNNQVRTCRLKTINSEAVLHVIEANLMSNFWKISRKLNISLSSVVCHLHNLVKSFQSCWIMHHVHKILQNIWFILLIMAQGHKYWEPSENLKTVVITFMIISYIRNSGNQNWFLHPVKMDLNSHKMSYHIFWIYIILQLRERYKHPYPTTKYGLKSTTTVFLQGWLRH